MAIIQWKQLSTHLSGSGQLTGSLDVSGSILLNGTNISSGGGSTDISSLNTFTGSIQTQVDGLSSATSSYITNLPTGLISQSGNIVDIPGVKIQYSNVYSNIGDLPSATDYHGMFAHVHSTGKAYFAHAGNWIALANENGNISSSAQILPIATSSITDFDNEVSRSVSETGFSNINFDGDRIVSNTDLGDLFTNNFNAGTSGSVTEFLESVFFPNSGPSFTSNTNISIAEFNTSGSNIHTITATDPESQTLTFSTQSSYTDDLVRVATNGVVTLNAVPTTETFNTVDRGDSTLAHEVPVQVTDTFNATANTTVYFNVVANSAPVFRQTSIYGNIINSFTSSRNENAASGEVGKIYFTDSNSDSITIRSGSDPNGHFSLVKNSTFVQINQVTASLNYEETTVYNLSLTASDEHFEAGQDTDAQTFLPITISVTDNLSPTINSQTLNSINENSSNGAVVDNIAASDSESDTITFRNFNLSRLELDNVEVSQGTYSGTSQATDPHENPFQMSNTGAVTRKNGVFINSDLINEYQYTVEVVDSFNTASNSATITIPITDDAAATITDNWSAGPYIKESEVSGSTIKTTDYGSTQADYNSNQSGTWSSSNSAISINSNGSLFINTNLSGSVTQSGDTVDSTITFTNLFGTTTTDALSVQVVANQAPSISFTNQTSNLNTNLAIPGTNLVTVSISDTENDTPYSASIQGTDGNLFLLNPQNSSTSSIFVEPASNLDAGSYTFSITAKDSYDKSTTESRTITISDADTGTLSTNGTFYLIESAVSGSLIRTNSNGRTGTQGDLAVSYSPDYGSQAVQNFTSSNDSIDINDNGNLSININISGSTTGSGDTIDSDITFGDQYGNIGSGSITINITANQNPVATFTNQNSVLTSSIDVNTNLVSVSITDDENDTPFNLSLSTSAPLTAVPKNANSSSYEIQNTGSLSDGVYIYTASLSDSFGKSESYNRTLTVAEERGLVYAYGINWGANPANENAFFGSAGDSGGDGIGIESGSVISHLQSGSIGSTFSTSYGAASTTTLFNSESLVDLSDSDTSGVSTLGYFNFSAGGQQHVLVVFPSSSFLDSKPTSMYDGVPPDSTGTNKEFYLYAKDASIPGTVSSGVYYFDVENTTEGSDRWGMIFTEGKNSNNSRYYLMPDTASAP